MVITYYPRKWLIVAYAILIVATITFVVSGVIVINAKNSTIQALRNDKSRLEQKIINLQAEYAHTSQQATR